MPYSQQNMARVTKLLAESQNLKRVIEHVILAENVVAFGIYVVQSAFFKVVVADWSFCRY
jgi:hypothetical protein